MANSIAYVLSKNTYPTTLEAGNVGISQGTRIVYATTSTLTTANILYADSRLTQPIYGDGTSWYSVQLLTNTAVVYSITISESGVIATAAPAGPTQYLILSLDTVTPSAFPSTGQACAGWTNPSYSFYSVYAAESSIGNVTYLYTDSGLTTPVANTSPSVAYNGLAVPVGESYTTPYTLQISGGTGQVSNLIACP